MAGDCSHDECPVMGGFLSYQPSREGNAAILAVFAALIPVTLGLGYRFKTPTFAVLLTAGLLMEVLGFSARVLMFENVASKAYFSLFFAGTILGPTFMAASIFQALPHVIAIYGKHASQVGPRQMGVLFAVLVAVIILLEAVGSALVTFRVGGLQASQSALIAVAGLVVQAIALLLFVGVHLWTTICLTGQHVRLDLKHATIYESARFRRFLFVMQVGALLLLGHTVYRAAELASGISGPIFQNQVAFMIANGALPLTVCVLLSVFPPGAAFGQAWGPTSPRRRGKRSPRPPPLAAPIAPYYTKMVPSRMDGADCKQQTPSSGGSMPLENSTMATSVRQNPATQTSAQPSPSAISPKNSPTYWREQRRLSNRTRADSNPQAAFHSPKTSPTFELAVQQARQSPTFHGQQPSPAWTGSRRNSRMAQTPGQLVRDDTLW